MQETKPGSFSLGCLFPSQTLVPYLHSIYVASCLSCYLSTWHKSNYFVAKAAAAGKVKKKIKIKKTLTPEQNCINNYLNGDMGNYAHSLPSSSLTGEDSEGNILPLFRGKRSFLNKVGFLQMLTMPGPPAHAPPSLELTARVSIHGAQHAKQIEGTSPPSLHPDKALSLSCQSKQCREEGAFFPQGNKSDLSIQESHGGFGTCPPAPCMKTVIFPPPLLMFTYKAVFN